MNQQNNYEKKCIYNCGQIAKFQFKNGKWCCSSNMNKCPQIKKIRSLHTTKTWLNNTREKKQKIDRINKKDIIMYKCEYGCNQNANYQLKNGKLCCSNCITKCPQIRKKNKNGLNKAYFENKGFSRKKIFSKEARYKMGATNRGLTKENCEHIKRKGETTKQRYQQGLIQPSFGQYKSSSFFKCGYYDNIYFHSSWELAFYVYHKENNILYFKRNENEILEFIFEGKKHKTKPDFKILNSNTFIEIKGAGYFFNPKFEEEKYKQTNHIVKYFYQKDLKIYINYCIEKYGINFANFLFKKA